MRWREYEEYDLIADDPEFSWQGKCSVLIEDKNNVIITSPTGTGKTEVFLEWALKRPERPIFITAPIKAISNSGTRDLYYKGYKVGINTGDLKYVPKDCEIIYCTQEIYTNNYAHMKNTTLIIDEYAYIVENPERARTYIDTTHYTKAKNVLICSATLGDIESFKEYVNKVSGRSFFAYENKSRATSLFFEGNIYPRNIKNAMVIAFSVDKIQRILDELSYIRSNQGKETEIKKLAKQYDIKNPEIINKAKYGVAGYYGSLLPKEKFFIENCFKEGLIDVVVGTDAMAYGVNFPVQNIVYAQLTKMGKTITKNMFDQINGRAARKEHYNEGHIYYCSEFADFCEPDDFISSRYEELLRAKNEDFGVVLAPDMKKILRGKSIEEEADYISRYSKPSVKYEEVYKQISERIADFKNTGFEDSVNTIREECKDDKSVCGYSDEVISAYNRYVALRRALIKFRDLTPDNIVITNLKSMLEDDKLKFGIYKIVGSIEKGESIESILLNEYGIKRCSRYLASNDEAKESVRLTELPEDMAERTDMKRLKIYLNWVFANKESIMDYIRRKDEEYEKVEKVEEFGRYRLVCGEYLSQAIEYLERFNEKWKFEEILSNLVYEGHLFEYPFLKDIDNDIHTKILNLYRSGYSWRAVAELKRWVYSNMDLIKAYLNEKDKEYSQFIAVDEKAQLQIRSDAYRAKEGEFYQNIGRVFFPEYSLRKNSEMFAKILFGKQENMLKDIYEAPFNEKLQFARYVKSLPKKYRKGLTEIYDWIRKIDSNAIDGNGILPTGKVAKALEKEGRLSGPNVNKTMEYIASQMSNKEKENSLQKN